VDKARIRVYLEHAKGSGLEDRLLRAYRLILVVADHTEEPCSNPGSAATEPESKGPAPTQTPNGEGRDDANKNSEPPRAD
jgi:hypothetical protein